MLGDCRQDIHGQEEDILGEDGPLGQSRIALIAPIQGPGPLNACPCDVDIEEDQ